MKKYLVIFLLLISVDVTAQDGWFQLGSSACDPNGTLCSERAQQENRPYYRTNWNGVSKCTVPGQTGQYNYVNCQYRHDDPCVNEEGSWNPSTGTCEIPSPELCDNSNQEIFIVDALGGRCARADQYPGCPAGYMGAKVNGVTSCYDPTVVPPDKIPPYAIPYVTGNESTPPPSNNVVDNDNDTQTENTETSQRNIVKDENGNIIEDVTTTTTTETTSNTNSNTSTTTTTTTYLDNLTGNTRVETTITQEPNGPERSASGGTNCGTPPSCNGDPINCAILNQTWLDRCKANHFVQAGNCSQAFQCEGDPISCAALKIEHNKLCDGNDGGEGDPDATGDCDPTDADYFECLQTIVDVEEGKADELVSGSTDAVTGALDGFEQDYKQFIEDEESNTLGVEPESFFEDIVADVFPKPSACTSLEFSYRSGGTIDCTKFEEFKKIFGWFLYVSTVVWIFFIVLTPIEGKV